MGVFSLFFFFFGADESSAVLRFSDTVFINNFLTVHKNNELDELAGQPEESVDRG